MQLASGNQLTLNGTLIDGTGAELIADGVLS